MTQLSNRRGKQWTADDDRRLTELVATDKSYTEIAKLLGRNTAATQQRASILGVATRGMSIRYSKQEKELIAQMVKDNREDYEIAAALNRHIKSVKNYIYHHGLRSLPVMQSESRVEAPAVNDKHRCLRCRKMFKPKDRGNHICPTCKRNPVDYGGMPECTLRFV